MASAYSLRLNERIIPLEVNTSVQYTEYFAQNVEVDVDSYVLLRYNENDSTWTPKLNSNSTSNAFTRIMERVIVIKPGVYDFYAQNIENTWSLYVALRSGSWQPSNHEQIQKGVMIQAWNWSFNTIRKELDNIKKAGYTTIQVSPIQQPKDYSSSSLSVLPYGDDPGNWWKLYQPINLDFAPDKPGDLNGAYSFLGSKTAFEQMVTAAHNKGLKVIVDIVCNHMADDGEGVVYPGIDPTIDRSWFREYHKIEDWNDSYQITKFSIGQPDLKTEQWEVQQRIISLLKSCIDAGADGFRFDAAKHIETPYDREYVKSDFWPNVLESAEKHALHTKNKTLYYYGEILDCNQAGRNYGMYIPFMNVTDNAVSNSARDTRIEQASWTVNPEYAVLWAESHDNYAHSGDGYSDAHILWINRTWGITASRAKFTALYCAPPVEMGNIKVGNTEFNGFKWNEVAAINRLHNEFAYSDREYGSDYYGLRMVERCFTNGSVWGAVVINATGQGATYVGIPTHDLDFGPYFDTITGNTFWVDGNYLTGDMGASGIAVLSRLYKPILHLESKDYVFDDSDGDYYIGVPLNAGEKCVIKSNYSDDWRLNFGYYSLTEESKALFDESDNNTFVPKIAGLYEFTIKVIDGAYRIIAHHDDTKAAIIFEPNGKNVQGTMPPQIITKGIKTYLTKNKFARNKYYFDGWATTPDGEVVCGDQADVFIEGDINVMTLYAVWVSDNTVTFRLGRVLTSQGMLKLEFPTDAWYTLPPTNKGIHVKNGDLILYSPPEGKMTVEGNANTAVTLQLGEDDE